VRTTSHIRWVIGRLIDRAPGWIWKPANIRFVGSHTVHFCFAGDGRRTVELDDRTLASGHRRWFLLQEPPGPHDPNGTVVQALLTACPSFGEAWDRHLDEWAASSDRGVYIDVGVFAQHLVGLLERRETDEFPAVFATIERLFGEGDDGVRYLLTAGLIEDLGNIGSNAHGWPFALQFRQWFGPHASRAWDDVRAVRGGELMTWK
jgi:hypothetical protein